LGAYLGAAWDVLREAGRRLWQGRGLDEMALMAGASLGALALGDLEEALGVMVFYKIGELLQERAEGQSRRSIRALLALRPDRARVRRRGIWVEIGPEDVVPGDLFLVRPGERVPVDGRVTEGRGSGDTSSLTGESLPRPLEPGDPIHSGTVVWDGALVCRAERPASSSSAARILELVEKAAASKARTERFLSRFARWYTPAVVGAALLVALLPPLVMAGESFGAWAYRGLVLLVISCPCALVVSVPLGYFAGLGGAAHRGILVKGAAALEALAEARVVVFDKTGTLTDGVFRVRRQVPAEGFTEEDLLMWAAAAGAHSNHPLARAVRRAWEEAGGEVREDGEEYEEIPGHGTGARVMGRKVLAGSLALLRLKGISGVPEGPGESEATAVHVAVEGVYAGVIEAGDGMKPGAPEALEELRRLGVERLVLLTGDGASPARRAGAQGGIDEIHAELRPEDKLAHLERLMEGGRERGSVVFVGDGVNDAPVLARADVGIAMGGSGADAAVESADVVLMTDDLSRVAEALRTARRTRRIVRENIVLVLAVKGVFLVLGALGYATMWGAVGADVGMALGAVLNARRAFR